MSGGGAAGSILLVAALLGAALGAVFLQLMSYSLAMKDYREFWIWLEEWAGADLLLTALLCRREILTLVKGKPAAEGGAAPPPRG